MTIKKILFYILILIPFITSGQQKETRTIDGIILDPDTDEALIGATVLIKGTEQGTTSDINGRFKLEILKNENVTLIISYGCPSFEVKTKKNKSFYKIRPNPYRSSLKKINLRYGLSKITHHKNKLKSNFQLGFIYEFATRTRFRIGTGLFYNNTNTSLGFSNFGSLGIPLSLNYLKRNLHFKGEGSINSIIHQKTESSTLNKFHPTVNGQIGYRLNHVLEVEAGLKYFWLESSEGQFNIINPFVGVSWNFN